MAAGAGVRPMPKSQKERPAGMYVSDRLGEDAWNIWLLASHAGVRGAGLEGK